MRFSIRFVVDYHHQLLLDRIKSKYKQNLISQFLFFFLLAFLRFFSRFCCWLNENCAENCWGQFSLEREREEGGRERGSMLAVFVLLWFFFFFFFFYAAQCVEKLNDFFCLAAAHAEA